MAWEEPRDWVDNELINADIMNTHVRDNLNYLFEMVPIGAVMPYAGTTAPSQWLLCDGSAVSRTTYSELFGVIGTTFGVGDGSTTFNVPDLRGRFPLGLDNLGGASANRVTATQADNLGQSSGSQTHTLAVSELPAHSHSASGYTLGGGATTGFNGTTSGTSPVTVNTNNAGSNGAHNNMPPYLSLGYIIRF